MYECLQLQLVHRVWRFWKSCFPIIIPSGSFPKAKKCMRHARSQPLSGEAKSECLTSSFLQTTVLFGQEASWQFLSELKSFPLHKNTFHSLKCFPQGITFSPLQSCDTQQKPLLRFPLLFSTFSWSLLGRVPISCSWGRAGVTRGGNSAKEPCLLSGEAQKSQKGKVIQ